MKEIVNKVQYLSIDKLKNHPDNPRRINKESFGKLKISIKNNPDYFETRPILCNTDYVVFAGNMRLKAGKEIGLTEVPVVIMDISPERQREILIRDNISNGDFDFEMLANQFETGELLEFGFTAEQLTGDFGTDDEEPKEEKTPKEKNEHSIKIIFKNAEDLENARVEIDGLSERYKGSYYVIEGGQT